MMMCNAAVVTSLVPCVLWHRASVLPPVVETQRFTKIQFSYAS